MMSKSKVMKAKGLVILWSYFILILLGLASVTPKEAGTDQSNSLTSAADLNKYNLGCIDGLIPCRGMCCDSCDSCPAGCPGFDNCCRDRCYWEVCRGYGATVAVCMVTCVPSCGFGNFKEQCQQQPC